MRTNYTNEQIDFIKQNVANTCKTLTEMFNKRFNVSKSVIAIKCLKGRLNLKSGLSGGNTKFTKEQIQFIKDNVVNTEKRLAEMINEKFGTNYTHIQISNLKNRLGIKSGLVGGRFVKGSEPKNKGKKWEDFMSIEGQINSRRTCFKKGHIPKNHRPVGSERINVDGYIEIKVAEPSKWKLKHRVVYESIYGEIPKAHKIIFLDGNKLNVDVSNLGIISNSQALIMNQNHYFTTNKELTQSGVIVSKLINQTRKKLKFKPLLDRLGDISREEINKKELRTISNNRKKYGIKE